jgi:hypothetical protein
LGASGFQLWFESVNSQPTNLNRGDNLMDVVFQKDIIKIFEDMQDVKESLDALRKDHAAWSISRELDDLMCIYQGLKSLESDVSVLMSDCSSLASARQNEMTMGDLNQAFRSLDIIYRDLKTVRKEIDESFTTEKKIEALEIDWAKFNKNVERIQNDLQQNRS